MAKVTVPIQVNLTRTDTSAMTQADVEEMDVFLSLDNGATFVNVDTVSPDTTEVIIDGMDPGTQGLLYSTETDKQTPARTSAKSAQVTFKVPVVLAAPNPPTLGTPVVS